MRMFDIDEYGSPWFACQFRTKTGKMEHHIFAVNTNDNN